MRRSPCCFISLCILLSPALSAQSHDIVIDGRMDDWKEVSPLIQYPETGPGNTLRLKGLWLADDDTYLFIRFELDREILLQENNGLALYLDIDGKGATGDLAGAEIAFNFGERKGWIQDGEESLPIEYEALDLYSAPSTFSASFEISISWKAHPWLEALGFGYHTLGIMLFDKSAKEILCHSLYRPSLQPRPPYILTTLGKAAPDHVRLVTHNVNKRHFLPDKKEAFSRVYGALDPDILLLEEAYDGNAGEILDYFREALGPSETWYAAKEGAEATVVLSRYPVTTVCALGNSAAYLIDLRPERETELALVVLSMPCCREDSARQAEADQIAAFVRDWQLPGTPGRLAPGTPIVLAGDANLVGPLEQLLTLTEGAIRDTTAYGQGLGPDWDGSSFADLCPLQLQRPVAATWRGKGFSPSRLDYILYSDYVLKIGRRFVFDTGGLTPELLRKYGLHPTDGPATYKHMPVVADLIFR